MPSIQANLTFWERDMSSTNQRPHMGKPANQHEAPQANASTGTPPTEAPYLPAVHVDSKGRLSVKAADLAASKAFRDQLDAMVELAKTHPPQKPNSKPQR